MSVEGINHVNIAAPAPLMQKVRDFYVDVIGLVDGERPNVGIPGHWLYGGGAPLIHLMQPRDEAQQPAPGSGAIDHVALTCTDLESMERRIEQSGTPFRKRDASDHGVVQLFVTDPAGVRVELNFRV